MKDKKHSEAMPIYPSHELKEKLRVEAEENHRSLNGQILFILEQYFKQKETARQPEAGSQDLTKQK